MYHECSIKSVTGMPRRLVQVGNIIRCDLQLFHPRRLCCPQLKTRYNSFICPMMTWPRTYPSTHFREKKQAVSNRGGLSTYRNQNGGNKVEAWFGAHQEGADIIIVQHNCSARCSYTHQRGIFWECQESSLQLQAVLWKTFIPLPITRLLMAERHWK